jgi:hypothetical protein
MPHATYTDPEVAQVGLAMTRTLGLRDLVSAIVPHPTRAELVRDPPTCT